MNEINIIRTKKNTIFNFWFELREGELKFKNITGISLKIFDFILN